MQARERILSLTFRYFPHVIGNGRSTVRELIRRDARAQWKSVLHFGNNPSHRRVDPFDLDRVPAGGEVVRIALINNQRWSAVPRRPPLYLRGAGRAVRRDRAQYAWIPLRSLRSALREYRSTNAGRVLLHCGDHWHWRRGDRLLGSALARFARSIDGRATAPPVHESGSAIGRAASGQWALRISWPAC